VPLDVHVEGNPRNPEVASPGKMSMSPPEKIVRFILQRRLALSLAVIASVAFFGYYLTKLEIDNDTMKSVPNTLEEKVDYERIQEIFSVPFTVLFIAEFEDWSLRAKIDSIAVWADAFDKIEVQGEKGVEGIAHIGGLQVPRAGGFFGLSSEPVVAPEDTSEQAIRESIARNREFTNIFISDNEKALGIVLGLNPEAYRPGALDEITRLVDLIDSNPSVRAAVAGAATHSYFIDKAMRSDFRVLLPLCILVAAFLLYLVFRRILHVVAVLLIIGFALIWTFGIMGLLGIPLSVVSSVIPVILFPIGVADSIHIIRTYSDFRYRENKSLFQSLSPTYHELLRPIVLTSLTTFVGFGSFLFSSISWTRYFGLFTGIGVILSLFFTVLLLPIFLSLESKNHGVKVSGTPETTQHTAPSWYRKLIFESPLWIGLVGVIVIVGVFGVAGVRVESNPLAMFAQSSPVRESDRLIEQYFGGTRFFSVMLRNTKGDLTGHEAWKDVARIAEYIESRERVGHVASLLPLINRTSMLLSNEPISRAGVSVLVGSGTLFGKKFRNIVDSWVAEDRRTTKLTVRCENVEGYKYTELADEIEEYVATEYPEWEVMAAGPALLIDSMISLLVGTQISTLLITFTTVFLFLSLLFKSVRIAFFAIIPIVLSTGFVYALMGAVGVSINTVTVFIVNTCIGIGIDYSIHFVSGYSYTLPRFPDNEGALLDTVRSKGAVIMFNTLVVGVGFLVLVISSFPPIRHFGFFVFISMLTSAVFSLIFLPLLFRVSPIRGKSG